LRMIFIYWQIGEGPWKTVNFRTRGQHNSFNPQVGSSLQYVKPTQSQIAVSTLPGSLRVTRKTSKVHNSVRAAEGIVQRSTILQVQHMVVLFPKASRLQVYSNHLVPGVTQSIDDRYSCSSFGPSNNNSLHRVTAGWYHPIDISTNPS